VTEQAEKQRLIDEVAGGDNATALAAVDMLRARGWLADGTLRGVRLAGANLRGADLSGADLFTANLAAANLPGAILTGAILTGADLTEANLRGAELTGTTLTAAIQTGAILSRADLFEANLRAANLSGADLSKVDLTRADLTEANLAGADLAGATLRDADLSNVDLTGAILHQARLDGADLRAAILLDADLTLADLSGASLAEADLTSADLTAASLEGTDFRRVTCTGTLFVDVDLSAAAGLETIRHWGPSEVGVHTLLRSKHLPEVFLRGCGLPDSFIEYLPSLKQEAIQFFSCFISYSHADAAFARLLHDRLQGEGVRCWLDEYEIVPGDKIVREVSEAIRIWDKVLLCCSETALHSWWVDKEIAMVLGKEQELTKQRGEEVLALIPLDLDGYLFEGYQGEYQHIIRARNAAHFQGWRGDHDLFEGQLARVVRALTVGGGKLPPPEPKL